MNRDVIIEELRNRLETMTVEEQRRLMQLIPTDQLLALASIPPPSSDHMTMREAILTALEQATKPLTSAELWQAAARLRPGSHEPSIRAEISALHRTNQIRVLGDPRHGGTYVSAKHSGFQKRAG
jgi:murein L,D-transpeptidase YcbB/YkuD